MYESEVNNIIEKGEEIPGDIFKKFKDIRNTISRKSLLPWTEHCIECVWPTCYTSCSLYSPRKDGKCQRFKNGMVRIPLGSHQGHYIIKVTFKKWGKLYAQGTTALFELEKADQLEQQDIRIGSLVQKLPAPGKLKERGYMKRYGMKNRKAKSLINEQPPPEFLAEIYNPNDRLINATLTMRPDGEQSFFPFQYLLQINPGYNQFNIDCVKINIDLSQSFKVEITPNDIHEGETLYFGIMDFVEIKRTGFQLKCVIWDLDNTLWKGTLVEDGESNLQLKENVLETIKTLDENGILQSVSSKNSREETLELLGKLGIAEYFLIPQINWGPKSNSIRFIVDNLNIGMDTVLFIDDQPFEREEAKSVFPELHVADPAAWSSVSQVLDLIDTTKTKESGSRRKLYQQEFKRKEIEASFEGDYFKFLRDCQLRMTIRNITDENFDRVHELVQRTNQMNFSGNRYSRNELMSIRESSEKMTLVLQVEDRFGDYGIVGFGIFDTKARLLEDLTFSCRVQSKRVEHAFLSWLITFAKENYGENPKVIYNKTPRNEPSGRVFRDFGFIHASGNPDNVLHLPENEPLPDDKIIEITSEEVE